MTQKEKIHIPTYINLLDQLSKTEKRSKAGLIKKQIAQVKQIKVKDIMIAPWVTLRPETDVKQAASLFISQRINPIPVVNEVSKLVGVVSRSDIIKLFI